MKRKKIFPFILMSALTLFCACSNDEITEEKFEKTELAETVEDFLCKIEPKTVSAEDFTKYAYGHAWKNVAEYEVDTKTGKAKDYDFWGRDGKTYGLAGGGPERALTFEEGVLTNYFYSDAIPAKGFSETSYTLDNKGISYYDIITKSNSLKYRIISIDEEKMVTLRFVGVRGNYEPIYSYTTFERMSQEAFDAVKKEYNTKL